MEARRKARRMNQDGETLHGGGDFAIFAPLVPQRSPANHEGGGEGATGLIIHPEG
jgi:hypothetical protein